MIKIDVDSYDCFAVLDDISQIFLHWITLVYPNFLSVAGHTETGCPLLALRVWWFGTGFEQTIFCLF